MASVTETAPFGEISSWRGWPAEVRRVVRDEDEPTCTTAVAGSVTSESLIKVSGGAVNDADAGGVDERPACGVPPDDDDVQEAVSAATASATAALMLLRSSPPGLRSTYLVGVTVTVPERPARLMLSPPM